MSSLERAWLLLLICAFVFVGGSWLISLDTPIARQSEPGLGLGSEPPKPAIRVSAPADQDENELVVNQHRERQAAQILNIVRAYEQQGLFALAASGCSGLIRQYPETEATTTARDLLLVLECRLKLEKEVKAPTPEFEKKKNAKQGSSDEKFVWILIEAEDPLAAADALPQGLMWISSETKSIANIPVYKCSPVKDAPEYALLLIKKRDSVRLHESSPSTVWQLDRNERPGEGRPLGVSYSSKTVFVHGYVRHDGTLVHSYFRSPPGTRLGSSHTSSHGASSAAHHGSGGHHSGGNGGGHHGGGRR